MASLLQIYHSLDGVSVTDGEKDSALVKLGEAINATRAALDHMNTMQVRGRDNVDVLLGCMMATEQIIGDNDGK